MAHYAQRHIWLYIIEKNASKNYCYIPNSIGLLQIINNWNSHEHSYCYIPKKVIFVTHVELFAVSCWASNDPRESFSTKQNVKKRVDVIHNLGGNLVSTRCIRIKYDYIPTTFYISCLLLGYYFHYVHQTSFSRNHQHGNEHSPIVKTTNIFDTCG